MTDFDQVLENCLGNLANGSLTLDECLLRYPEHATQLRPLLLTVSRLARGRQVTPSPAFKSRARAKLTLHMQTHPRRTLGLPFFRRLAVSMAMLIAAFLAAGTAYAQSALPGDFFYEWKLASEQTWRTVASDTLEVDLILLDRRVDELVAVSNDPAQNDQALAAYQEALARLTVQADADAQARILSALQSQQESLAQAGISVPELDIYLDAVEEVIPTPSPLPVPTVIPTAAPTPIPTTIPTIIPTLPVPTLSFPSLP